MSTQTFVICRAGYGNGNPPDAKYAAHAAEVRGAGTALGAYWFWYLGQDNAAAVNQFLAVAGSADFLALDLEGNAHDGPQGHAEAADFIARVHAVGRKICLYHSMSGFPSLGQDWNWVAYWGSVEPPMAHTFWQFSDGENLVPSVDHDRFNRDASAFAAFIEEQGMNPAFVTDPKPKIAAFPAGESMFDIDGVAVVGKVPAGYSAAYSPFACGNLRALVVSWAAGKWKVCLAAPASVADVAGQITQAQLDAAVLAAKQAQYDADRASVGLSNPRPT